MNSDIQRHREAANRSPDPTTGLLRHVDLDLMGSAEEYHAALSADPDLQFSLDANLAAFSELLDPDRLRLLTPEQHARVAAILQKVAERMRYRTFAPRLQAAAQGRAAPTWARTP